MLTLNIPLGHHKVDVHAQHRKGLGEGRGLAGGRRLLPDGRTEGDVWPAHGEQHQH
jgi:hypothetical protein